MSIVQQSYEFLQTKLLPHISRKHHPLFSFGFSALTMQPFVNLNSNARMTNSNRNTAESKIRRIMKKEKMLEHFSNLVTQLQLVSATDHINVDFSTFVNLILYKNDFIQKHEIQYKSVRGFLKLDPCESRTSK